MRSEGVSTTSWLGSAFSSTGSGTFDSSGAREPARYITLHSPGGLQLRASGRERPMPEKCTKIYLAAHYATPQSMAFSCGISSPWGGSDRPVIHDRHT